MVEAEIIKKEYNLKAEICIQLNKESNNSWKWLLTATKKDIDEEFEYWTQEEWDKPLEYWVKTVLKKND